MSGPKSGTWLFAEFYQAENAKDLSENGTGLGLVMVK